MSKPQLVIVPGAWHPPYYMDATNKILESQGYTIHATQMPAVGNPKPCSDLSEDFAALHKLVDEAIGPNGNDVVVICHSWGGIVVSGGLLGYGKAEREKEGKKGGVVNIGYMTAFIADEGQCLMDMLPGQPPWFELKDDNLYHVTDPYPLYNDLSPADQKHWFSRLKSQAPSSFTAKIPGAAWKQIPVSYLVCEDDLAIPVQGQDGMVEFARSQGIQVEVTRLKSSHSPFLSMPDETVSWIKSCAGEKV